MSDITKQTYYSAGQDLNLVPKGIRLAIRTNLIVTFWLPVVAMAISDYYLGRIPHVMIIIFTLALFVLYSKIYEDTTKFSLHPILIHFQTFSTPAMLFVIAYYKSWPLELVIAESVAIEMLAFTTSLVVLFLWETVIPKKKNSQKEKTSNSTWYGSMLTLLMVLVGLATFVLIIYFRFEGVFNFFMMTLNAYPEEAIYIAIPFVFVVIKHLVTCYSGATTTTQGKEDINIISLNYGVPMLLNLLVPLVMHMALYYVPKT
jgi:hypothetical protein